MTSWALRGYHALPAPLRNAVASARGRVLRGWRYGPETDALVEEALDRERWSAERWVVWREERLARVLHRAATRVPYYRAQWTERRRRGDRATWDRLEHWPVLAKSSVRAAPEAFVADDCRTAAMFHEHTSGTTGTSLDLWWSQATVRAWYALYEARTRRWHGVSRHDPWAIFGGQLVVPVARTRPPYWVWNGAMRQLYCSAYHLAPSTAGDYASALGRHGVRYAVGYPSALHTLARDAVARGVFLPPLRVVVANAEPLDAEQRAAVAQGFGCPVRETYGMAEIVAAASECAVGTLHLWPEVGVVETRDGNGETPPGVAGDLVCTGLLNADMPLIRYAVGDRGALAEAAPCGCGRALPALAGVEGRSDDLLYSRDGRRIGRMDPAFKRRLAVVEAQIIQEALDEVRVLVVRAPGDRAATDRAIAAAIRERLGDVRVCVDAVPAIARTANGKFRATVCRIPQHARPGAARDEVVPT